METISPPFFVDVTDIISRDIILSLVKTLNPNDNSIFVEESTNDGIDFLNRCYLLYMANEHKSKIAKHAQK